MSHETTSANCPSAAVSSLVLSIISIGLLATGCGPPF